MKARIEEIRLQNFRAFENARLSLSDLTFLVGRNGAGKSSLLDAIELMREALTDSLPNALDRRNGLVGIKRKTADADAPVGIAILLHLDLGLRSVRVLYGFRLYMADGELEVDEALRCPDLDPIENGTEEQRARKRWGFLRGPGGFQVDASVAPAQARQRLLLPQVAEAQELWAMTWDALSEMRCYELSPYVMAAPSPIGQRTTLDRNGTNVGDVVSHLAERPEDQAWVNRHLGGVTDGIVAVGVRVDDGYRRLQLIQSAGPEGGQLLSARQVSQGTLRALGVLLALRQLPAPSLVMLDEIEDSIHPLAVDVLLEAIEQSSVRFPIVVTTHSPEVLGRKPATGDRLRVLQWRDGVSRIHRLGKGTLEQLDAVTTVGWLLSTNGLGLSQPQEAWAGDLLEWR